MSAKNSPSCQISRFKHTNIGAVDGTEKQGTVKAELHVTLCQVSKDQPL